MTRTVFRTSTLIRASATNFGEGVELDVNREVMVGVCHQIITQTTIEVALTALSFDVNSANVECHEEKVYSRQLLYSQ